MAALLVNERVEHAQHEKDIFFFLIITPINYRGIRPDCEEIVAMSF